MADPAVLYYIKIRKALRNLLPEVQVEVARVVECKDEPHITPDSFLRVLQDHVPRGGTKGYLNETDLEPLAALLQGLRDEFPALDKVLNLIRQRQQVLNGEVPAASSIAQEHHAHLQPKTPNPHPGQQQQQPPCADPAHFVILCVKDHERDEMRSELEYVGFKRQATQRDMLAHLDASYSRLDFERGDGDGKIKISLVSFQGGVQGPVVTAIRVSQIAMAFEAKDNRHIRFGMVGICGGRRLGEVFIGLKAEAPEARTVQGTEDGDYRATDHKRATVDLAYACHGGAQFARKQDKLPQENEDHLTDGEFLSYTAVREDCSMLIGERKACVEMEAFAFFKTLQELGLDRQVLPVIKAVSDVGREDWRDAHNQGFMRQRGWASGESHDRARKLCRSAAAKLAARAMVRLINHLNTQP